MDISSLVGELDVELRAVGDNDRADGAKAYLKSDLEFLGVAAKPLRDVARSFLGRHPELDRANLVELVCSLWERPVFSGFCVRKRGGRRPTAPRRRDGRG